MNNCVYLVDSENPHAVSMAKKLSEAKPGDVVYCTKEEIKTRYSGEVITMHVSSNVED